MSRRRWRLLLLAELSKEMFIEVQSELGLTNSAFLVLLLFCLRQLSSLFFKVAVFLFKYVGLIYTTGQGKVFLLGYSLFM